MNDVHAARRKVEPLRITSWVASLDAPGQPGGEGTDHVIVLGVGSERALRLHGRDQAPLPLHARHEHCGMILDGILYNRGDLIADDAVAGELNDAELILRAYEQAGEVILSKIKGLFALVLWDGDRDLFLCMRDQLGFYPLYYARLGNQWLVSTSIETLVQHPGFSATINRLAVVNRILHRWENETLYDGVERILPGHSFRLCGQRLDVSRYWNPVLPEEKDDWIEEEAQELFDALLDQAVARHITLGNPAIFLSGGLDSISVAAVAADLTRRTNRPAPLALSLIFPHPNHDEQIIQRGIARQLDLPQIILSIDDVVGPRGLVFAALEMTRQRSIPLLNFWLPAYYGLSLLAKDRGYQSILTGGGGDEWLGVTPLLAADLIRSFDVVNLYHLWRASSRSYTISQLLFARNLVWRFGLRPLAKQVVTCVAERAAPQAFHSFLCRRHSRGLPEWIPADEGLRRELHSRVAASVVASNGPRSGSFYLDELLTGLDHPLVSLEMEENFETARRSGMPILQPFWDVDLVDTLFRTSPRVLNYGGRSKGLVRQSLAHRFPELGFERQKKVLAVTFFNAVVRKNGLAAWQDIGGAQALADLDIAEPGSLERVMLQLLAERRNLSLFRVWDILNLEVWLRAHL